MSKLLGVLVAGLCATAALAQTGPAGAPAPDTPTSRLGSTASTGAPDRNDADTTRLGAGRADEGLRAQPRGTDRQLGANDRLDRFAQSDDDRSYSRGDRDPDGRGDRPRDKDAPARAPRPTW